MKQFRKLTVLLLAAALLSGSIAQAAPVYAAEAESEAAAETETEAVVEAESEAATEAVEGTVTEADIEAVTEERTEAVTETEHITETKTESETAEYSICFFQEGEVYKEGSFTSAGDGLYTYSTPLYITESGWSEYELCLTIDGKDYGAEDWVIYDCVEDLQLSELGSTGEGGVFSLWLCNTRSGIYTFTLDPASLTLSVSGAADHYGAFLVFTELTADGELPYYYMDDLGATDTFGEAEETMMVKVPSWEPDGYWDIQIASGGQFYGQDGLQIDGASGQIYTLSPGQTSQFACLDPHVWYDFYFGAESHKMTISDGGEIMCGVNFSVHTMAGEPLDAKITVNGQEIIGQETYVEATTLNVAAPKIEGYHFVGWYGAPYGSEWWAEDDELLWVEPEYEYIVRDFSFEKIQNLDAVYEEGDEVTYELDKTSIPKLAVESTEQLTLVGSDGSIGEGTWTSSDERIASVDENGLVTAVRYGTATIHVVMDNGYEADCSVQTRFKDVAGSPVKGEPDYQYFYDAVYWAANFSEPEPITRGYDLKEFGVGMNCERQDFILFLYRLAGKPASSTSGLDKTFSDVSKLSNSFRSAIAWGSREGIIKGYTSGPNKGKFGVGLNITRREAMIMLWRYAGKPAPRAADIDKAKKLTDVEGKFAASTDTYKAIAWAAGHGITNGYTKQSDIPKEFNYKVPCFGCDMPCLREQMIVFLNRASKL